MIPIHRNVKLTIVEIATLSTIAEQHIDSIDEAEIIKRILKTANKKLDRELKKYHHEN